ncbi:MAG: YheC/YheD family protein [Gammaproteobacteria bacterium]|nr:YheC/YheD family protein [Gammaproteobacteria bacterium]
MERLIGLLCNCSMVRDPMAQLSPSIINRAFLIERMLRPEGIGVFLWSPRGVTSADVIEGYTVSGDELVAGRRPMPRVNANWTYGTRRMLKDGIGYNHFKRLVQDAGVRVYVPYVFAEVVSNKRKAYDVVRSFDTALHPRTEDYTGALLQVESFLRDAGTVFIKPRSGNRGNRIFVLRRVAGGFALKYYEEGEQRQFPLLGLEAAISVVQGAAGGRSYVIQSGIEPLQVDGSVFDVRVVMVNDGRRWHSIFETRLAPPGSDLSNIYQGGSICVTETLLTQHLGSAAARDALATVDRAAHGLAAYLESLYPGDLMELGFDFVLDRGCAPHLVEVNSKPGVAGFGSETSIFEWTAAEEASYERWVKPHVTHLAAFLKAKLESAEINGT